MQGAEPYALIVIAGALDVEKEDVAAQLICALKQRPEIKQVIVAPNRNRSYYVSKLLQTDIQARAGSIGDKMRDASVLLCVMRQFLFECSRTVRLANKYGVPVVDMHAQTLEAVMRRYEEDYRKQTTQAEDPA